MATQALNTRCRADKSYHLVVSFPPGENPTREQLADIEDTLCEALGFGEHQRVSAYHRNVEHGHFHVAINRIHPVTLHALQPFRDHFRLQSAGAELEIKHGLTRTVHSRNAAEAAQNGRAPNVVRKPDVAAALFQQDRTAALTSRDKAMREMRARQIDYARRLSTWHSERLRREAALNLKGVLKRDGYAHLAEQRRKDRAERLAREKTERLAALAAHPLPRWSDYAPPRAVMNEKPSAEISNKRAISSQEAAHER